MNVKIIEELARVLRENDLTALEVEEDGLSVKLERKPEASAVSSAAPLKAAAPFVPAAADGTDVPVTAAPQKEMGTLVISPTVGVFYAASSPDSKPFVEVGDRVKKGDILCIIEAMKLMNEIPAEMDGTVAEICVSNGQVVEYNQPLFRIVQQ